MEVDGRAIRELPVALKEEQSVLWFANLEYEGLVLVVDGFVSCCMN